MNWLLLPAARMAAELPAACRGARAVIVMPCTEVEQASQAARLMCGRAGVADAVVVAVLDEAREGFVAVANRAFSLTESPYFGYAAQDAFAGRQWLRLALQTLEQQNKGLLGFNDGKWGGLLAAFGLGRRGWLAHNYGGSLFFEGYAQHYADTELTVLALGNSQYCYSPQAVLVELDWEKDKKPVNSDDKMLFSKRKTGWLREHVSQAGCLEIFK